MRGCNCGTVHEDAHAPGCSGFAVEYHRLTADNALLRADIARLRRALERALNNYKNSAPYAQWSPWMFEAEDALSGTSDEWLRALVTRAVEAGDENVDGGNNKWAGLLRAVERMKGKR